VEPLRPADTQPDSPTSADALSSGESWFGDPESLLSSLRSSPREGEKPSIDGYEILHEIARGGQGIVYLAVQRSTRRQVALKLLMERGFATSAARRRFEREIELLASIDHEGIVKVFDSGVSREGLLYLVMAMVEGVPLDRFIRSQSPTHGTSAGETTATADVHGTLRLLADVADAMHAAHRRGVIHRDLKPSNILVDRDGHARIVDFGLARALDRSPTEPTVSVSGQFLGSLPWASPEHAAGRPDAVDVRSDIYSLGVILFQALTGEFPYAVDGSLAATLKAITEESPARASSRRRGISRDLDAVIATCLAKHPDHRFASAAELADDLRAVISGAPIRARRDSTWDGMTRTLRRYRLIAFVSSVAAVAVCVFAALAWRSSTIANAERGRAERRFNEARELARRFLFDFHEAVLPLAGSRPAREKIVAAALDYLTGLEAEVGEDTQFRADLAAAYERVADIQGNPTMPNLGQTAEAIRSLEKAISLREANLAVDASDPVALRSAARAINLLGLLQNQTSASKEALETLQRADLHLQKAKAITPLDPLLLREIAANRDRASTVYSSLNDNDASLRSLDEGLAALEAIPDRPSQLDAIEVLLYKKAFSLRSLKRFDEALIAAERTVGISRELAEKAPESAVRRRSLSVNLNELAMTQLWLTKYADARRTMEESVAISRALYEAEPANATTINDLAYALARSAQVEQEERHYGPAIERFAEVRTLRARASALDPANAIIRRGVAIASAMSAAVAEAGFGDASLPTVDREKFRTVAMEQYRMAKEDLEAMQRDGVLLPGDDQSIVEMATGLARVSDPNPKQAPPS
jgi:serine/threonine protein kinase/tetratricopeptide (TPR) repeat protein